MKKLLFAILIALASFTICLVGCSDSSTRNTEKESIDDILKREKYDTTRNFYRSYEQVEKSYYSDLDYYNNWVEDYAEEEVDERTQDVIDEFLELHDDLYVRPRYNILKMMDSLELDSIECFSLYNVKEIRLKLEEINIEEDNFGDDFIVYKITDKEGKYITYLESYEIDLDSNYLVFKEADDVRYYYVLNKEVLFIWEDTEEVNYERYNELYERIQTLIEYQD